MGVREYPSRWGWRKTNEVAARVRRTANPMRTLRLWLTCELQRPPQRRHKRSRLGDGTAVKLRAERPDHVWALDFQFDEIAARRRLKLLSVIAEHTCEAFAIKMDHSIDADGVVATVEAIAAARGAPSHLRTDNSPDLVVGAPRDWCRLSGTQTAYIEPGTPRENGHIESLNRRLRDECLNIEDSANLTETRVVIENRVLRLT
ncbi:integrase core domain-containing protein [Candidatus Poriferisodalis sp.]|uniref:integrase core domain-containing protein n=1 Tax=Candidatus Poriferisodalis sp. TaxID=3101277 RepID=UPI003B52A1B9